MIPIMTKTIATDINIFANLSKTIGFPPFIIS